MPVRRLAKLAIAGMVISFVAGDAYFYLQATVHIGDPSIPVRTLYSIRSIANPYSIAALIGGLLQFVGCRYLLRRKQFSRWLLGLASIGLLATLVGVTVMREAIRLQAIVVTKLYEQHAKAAQVGGWWVFAFFLAANALLISWCIRLVKNRVPA
jgi:hypothetical protein